MNRLEPQIIVENAAGHRGTTVPDFMNCCGANETPVVWEGQTAFEGTFTRDLKLIGPENAVAEPVACGLGRGSQCCIFLTADNGGFRCNRHSWTRYAIIFASDQMLAQRHPTAIYPRCKLPCPSDK